MQNPTKKPRMRRCRSAVVALLVCVAAGSVQAADSGARHHAEGTFDAATGAYLVVKGDDLYEIAERFGVTVDELKSTNKLASQRRRTSICPTADTRATRG